MEGKEGEGRGKDREEGEAAGGCCSSSSVSESGSSRGLGQGGERREEEEEEEEVEEYLIGVSGSYSGGRGSISFKRLSSASFIIGCAASPIVLWVIRMEIIALRHVVVYLHAHLATLTLNEAIEFIPLKAKYSG
eukprot:Nk52_evm1s583 gene=Nk52_evmTU1s583